MDTVPRNISPSRQGSRTSVGHSTSTAPRRRIAALRRLAVILAAMVPLVAGLAISPARAIAPTTPDSFMWQVNGRVRSIVETPKVVLPDKGTIVYQDSTLTMLDNDTTIRSTVAGNCTGSGACIGGQGFRSDQQVTYVPEPTLKDTAGNQADGSYTGSLAIF